MLLFFAIFGALTLFAFVIVAIAFLLASLTPDEPVTVRPREPELVPLVPTSVRKQRPDIWVN